MLGLVEDLSHIQLTSKSKNLIYVLGEDKEELEKWILKIIPQKVEGNSPQIDLPTEKKLQDTVLELIRKKLINSAHDISEGELFVRLLNAVLSMKKKCSGRK